MRFALFTAVIFSHLACAPAAAQDNMTTSPQTQSVEPRVAKAGTVILIKGVSLSKDLVEEVYLTDHRFDLKVKVLRQEDELIEIRVPPFVKPGRLQLLYLAGGKRQAYLEQPYFVQILDNDEPLPSVVSKRSEITKKAPPPRAEVASVSPQIPVMAPAPAPVKETQQTGVLPAKLLKRTPVQFPATSAGTSSFGTALELIAVVRANGTVKDVRVVRGNPFFAQSAATAIRQWLYEPAHVNGHAVDSEVAIQLSLRQK